jgi:riboflavin kinase/FMN adenylyltransferase
LKDLRFLPIVTFPQPLDLPDGCVAAIGNFDGVHAGHRSLLALARAEAGARGLPLAALTFEPHPRSVLMPEAPLKRLTELPDKARLLAEAGADVVAVLPFDATVAGWLATRFMDDILADWLHAKAVAVGENFRFGYKAQGDQLTLRADGRFGVVVAPLLADAGGVVSSRRLRGGG